MMQRSAIGYLLLTLIDYSRSDGATAARRPRLWPSFRAACLALDEQGVSSNKHEPHPIAALRFQYKTKEGHDVTQTPKG
jgi:hypothetical protein